jgi:predicted ATPase
MAEHSEPKHPFIEKLGLRNLLSYGPSLQNFELGPLNVLIGPNASGKSNLIEAIAFLRATPGDLRGVIRKGGGVREWIWKGAGQDGASVEAVIANPKGKQSLRHVLSFHAESQAFAVEDERIENETPYGGHDAPYFYYRFESGRGVLNVQDRQRSLSREQVQADQSILAQRRDPDAYPELSYLADSYERIRVYREWCFGRNTVFREPQKADMRNDRLEEDFSNLGLFLNRLWRSPKTKQVILDRLRQLYEDLSDCHINVEGGTVQVFLVEGDFSIPATRLSDGTLRYLCLLAILCDPDPPPLVCIEEPELGLHPDILPKVADLLVEASARTQLIVTTHSDILVDALTETPEAVVVCEKIGGQTELRRLDPNQLEAWLKTYRLGELWTRGELGGTRW